MNSEPPPFSFDESTLIVRVVPEGYALGKDSDERYLATWGNTDATQEEAYAAIRSLADHPDGYVLPYDFSQRLSQVSWGASGGVVEYLMDVGTGLSTEVIVAGIGYTVGKLKSKRDERPPLGKPTVEEARAAAERTFGLSEGEAEAFEVLEVEESADVSRFSFQSEEHTYLVSFYALQSGDVAVRVKRTRD